MDEGIILILDSLPDSFDTISGKLELHFKNKRKSGGEITDIRKHPTDDKKALLVYSDKQDAKAVFEKRVHKLNFRRHGDVKLFVKRHDDDFDGDDGSTPNKRKRNSLESSHVVDAMDDSILENTSNNLRTDETGERQNLLLVNSTESVSQKILIEYFEKFSDSVEIHEERGQSWIVKLKSPQDVQRALRQRKHDFGITVKVYHGEEHPGSKCLGGEKDSNDTIIVTNKRATELKVEILQMYLERFSDNLEINPNGKTQWIVKFPSSSEAQSVLALDKHDLDIEVEMYNNESLKKKRDPRRFILSGFQEMCTLQMVDLFIGSCSKGKRHSWELLEDDRVLVTFREDIDIKSFLKKCSSKKVENLQITAMCLERPDSVLVQGDMSKIPDEALMLYFSNSKRSGGTDVVSILWLEERRSVAVVFEDCQAVCQVMEKKHCLFNTDLSTSPFYSTIQQSLKGRSPSSLVKPSEISILIQEAVYGYITRNEVCRKEISQELALIHCHVVFEKNPNPSLILKFNAGPETILALRLGHSWEDKAKRAAQDVINKYSVCELDVDPDVWTRIEADSVNLSSLNASVCYQKEGNKVVVVGLEGDVKNCMKEIEGLKTRASHVLELERNTVEKQVKVGSPQELYFVWERVHTKAKDIALSKDDENLCFTLKGLKDHVTKVEGMLKDTKGNFVNQPLQLSAALIAFIEAVGPKKLMKDLAQNNISVSLLKQGEVLHVIADKSDVQMAENKLCEMLKEEEIKLSQDQELVIQGEEWKDFYKNLKDEVKSSNNVLHLNVLSQKITLCGYSSVVTDVSHKLKGYLENNKPTTEVVHLKSVKEAELVNACMNLSEVPELKSLHVTILPNMTEASPSLNVTAPSSYIKRAVDVVRNKVAQIVDKTLSFPKAGQAKVLEKHKVSLQTKANEMGCKLYFAVQKPPAVHVPDGLTVAPAVTAPPLPVKAPEPASSPPTNAGSDLKVIIHGVSVFLKKGDITKETMDVIVNSTNSTLNLDTGVAAAIMKAAGKTVVDKCQALGSQTSDAVVLTSGGNLSCKYIAHLVGPNKAADITASIEKVLDLCEGKSASSLSIPAIGTGRGGIGPVESVQAILKGLESHLSRLTSTSVHTMNLVMFEQKIFDACSDFFKQKKTKSSPKRLSLSGTLAPDQVRIGPMTIHVKKGNITTETVRGIVNTTSSDMSLRTGVSGAIFKAAGPSVEQECKAHGPLQGNSAAVTGGGNLSCDHILHMIGPHSAADASARVQKVLESCEQNNITTVSFPAVGTGGGGITAKEAVAAMLQGMKDHISQCPLTIVKLVYIVIDRDVILQDFLQGLVHWNASKQTSDQDSSEEEDDDDEMAEDDDDDDGGCSGEQSSDGSGYSTISDSDEDDDSTQDDKTIETKVGCIKVKVFTGDLTKEPTDAIVNSTSTSLDLSSGVSGAILRAAGQTVVDECQKLGTQPADGVVLTKAGKLGAKHIVHMVGQTKEKDITTSMYKVLKLCETSGIQSVSFPALGTGAGKLGPAQVAQAMIDAISNFTVDNPKTLSVVHIVIFQAQMLPDFVTTLKRIKTVTPAGIFGPLTSITNTAKKLSSLIRTMKPPTPPKPLTAALAKVTFPVMAVEVYSTSPSGLAQIQSLLNDLLQEECTSQDVDSRHLDKLSENDKQAIVTLCQGQEVHICLDPNKGLLVSGKRDDVLSAVVKIKDLLYGAQERETRESEEKRVKDTLRWEMADNETWQPFDSSISYSIELAYHRKEKSVRVQHGGETYTVDMKAKTCTNSKGRTFTVKRTLLGDSNTAIIDPPATWSQMNGKDIKIVTLTSTSDEFKRIADGFLKTSVHPNSSTPENYTIVKIERIQSLHQWQRYALLKQDIEKRRPGKQNERQLYHGTTTEIAKKINSDGFNRSFCGRNATVHGLGTYFAKDSWYSCSDTYSNPDSNGHKYIYLARVLTGSICASKKDMKEPDPLDPMNPQAGLHNCAVDNVHSPFIFVVFCDAGAYPDYLITFKKA